MKKILILMMIALMFVPLVSAADGNNIFNTWDNVLDYSENDLNVSFSNSFLLLFKTSHIGTAKLQSHSSVDEVRQIGAGNQVVMWYDFDFKGLYENGLGEIEFTDVKTGEEIERDYSFVYWGEEEYEIPTYSQITLINGTKVQAKTGTKIKTRETWLPYDSTDIPQGKIRIGLQTYVEVGDLVDGVWIIAGKKVKKHAVWDENLNINLARFFKMDEISGTVAEDSTQTQNGTANNSAVFDGAKAGIINTSADLSGGHYIDLGTNFYDMGIRTTMTISAWVNFTAVATGNHEVISDYNSDGVLIRYKSTDELLVAVEGASYQSFTTTTSPVTVGMHHIVILWGSNNLSLYVDDVYVDSVVTTVTLGDSISNARFGAKNDGTNLFDKGDVDEIAIWNDTKSRAQITQLNNAGAAISWIPSFIPVPTIVLNAPANLSTVTSPDVVFNATANDNLGLANMSLIVNGSYVSTNSTPYNNTLTQFPHTLTSIGFWNWTVEACDADVNCVNATLQGLTYQNDLAISLNSPINAFNSTSQSIRFNGTGKDDTSIMNMSMIVNGSYNGTNSSVFNNTLTNFDRTLADGFYNWTMEVCDIYNCVNATTRNVSIDSINPLLNLINPTGNVSYSNGTTGIVEWTATDDNIDACFLEYAGINETVTCADNSSIFNLTSSRTIIFWVNDTFGNIVSNRNVWDYLIVENNQTFNATTSETASETFYINITAATTPSSAKFIYNGSSSTATITNVVGNTYNISRTIDIPLIVEDKPFFWNITVWGTEIQTPITNQTINPTNLAMMSNATCASGYSSYINFSFADEGNSNLLNGSVSSSSFEYYLGSGDITKTLSASNSTENPYYLLCLFPQNRTINIDYLISYGATGYPQRTFDPPTTSFINTTTNKTLHLLSSADGLYVTFQVINLANQAVSDVEINASTLIGGSPTAVGYGTTGADGGITFWLDPDKPHTFYFVSSEYTTYITTLTPTQSTYTITLSSTAATGTVDYTRGIIYTILPTAGTTLLNGTDYSFNFTMNSTYWILDSFSFYLEGDNGTILGSDSSTATTGTIDVTANTLNYTSITMHYAWTANSTTTNLTVFWFVYDSTGGTGWSIRAFFTSVSTYLAGGIFGLNSTGLALLIFVLIFAVTGFMAHKYSITSPATISATIFVLVLFFDVILGLIPTPVNAVPYFPTIFFGLIMVGFVIKGAIR